MRIEVRLYASLRKYAPGKDLGEPLWVELPEGSTGADLLRVLRVPAEEGKLFILNGVREEPEVSLRDGDRVGVFPPIGGG